MKVGELRRALNGIPDGTEVLVRISLDEEPRGCVFMAKQASQEEDHLGEDPPVFMIDADQEEEEDDLPPPVRILKSV